MSEQSHETDTVQVELNRAQYLPEEQLPRVRDHSYLPGTCHPLHTGFVSKRSSKRNESKELPIIEIPGVVLFPGSTIPIRLTSRAWIEYLGKKIETSRAMPGQEDDVELGVLTFIEQDADSRRMQRRSWTRQGLGPRRLRRYSLQVQRELLMERWDNEDSDDTNHAVTELEDTDSESEEEPPPVQRRRFVGRVGTVATVTFTHGDMRTSASPRVSGQLVLTALGTQRFYVPPNEHNERQEQTPGHADFGVKVLLVDLFDDDVPSEHACKVTLSGRTPHAISVLTPLPEYLFKSFWPWYLQTQIRRLMNDIATFHELSRHLWSLEKDESELSSETQPWSNPIDFTFWLASNLPLKQEEKLNLIEMRSVLELLLCLKKKVSKERNLVSRIRCKECGVNLTNADEVFTVGGAEGTTGAYVNVHGNIIQTTTVRTLDEECVSYYGFPQTLDSWFPGYAWTIMSCGFCHSHLGWKFTTVGQRKLNKAARERPDFFYGLAASSIRTHTSRSRGRNSNSRRMFQV